MIGILFILTFAGTKLVKGELVMDSQPFDVQIATFIAVAFIAINCTVMMLVQVCMLGLIEEAFKRLYNVEYDTKLEDSGY